MKTKMENNMKKLIGLILFISGCAVPVAEPAKKVDLEPVIRGVVRASKCAKYSFKNRGLPPASYLDFVVLGYHKEFCAKKPELPLGPASTDALAHYGLKPNLKNTYTLLIGLGMRESSGKSCTGRDASASNITAHEAEAGPFQSSFNSMIVGMIKNGKTVYIEDGGLREIFNRHKGCSTHPCTGSQATVYGKGEGAAFQKLSKECPAFAVEYNARLIRLKRGHFGPINRREVEFKQECVDLLTQVEALGCET